MGERLNHRPTEMSGGEQQRVALAWALVNHPPLILATHDPAVAGGPTCHIIYFKDGMVDREERPGALRQSSPNGAVATAGRGLRVIWVQAGWVPGRRGGRPCPPGVGRGNPFYAVKPVRLLKLHEAVAYGAIGGGSLAANGHEQMADVTRNVSQRITDETNG